MTLHDEDCFCSWCVFVSDVPDPETSILATDVFSPGPVPTREIDPDETEDACERCGRAVRECIGKETSR